MTSHQGNWLLYKPLPDMTGHYTNENLRSSSKTNTIDLRLLSTISASSVRAHGGAHLPRTVFTHEPDLKFVCIQNNRNGSIVMNLDEHHRAELPIFNALYTFLR